MITTNIDKRTGKEYITLHAWKNGGAVQVCEVLLKREKSMRIRNLDNMMEVTVPYSGLKSMADAAKEYAGTADYYPATWWMSSPDISEYVRKAIGRA